VNTKFWKFNGKV